MSQILVGHSSAHATAFRHTILSQPESYLSKLFISAIIRMSQALVGCYSAHAPASARTILSLPEPPLYRFPLFSILDFSATQPLLRGVQTRETGVCRVSFRPVNGCVALTPFQPTACLCIPLCTNSIVLQALRERYNAYRCLSLPCIYHVPVYINL